MRPLVVLAVLLVACGRPDREDPSDSASQPTLAQRGPDPIALRIPRNGGTASAYAYPRLDSAVWTSADALPTVAGMLAFDAEAGEVALASTRGLPVRLDLRLGAVGTSGSTRLTALTSLDGAATYGVDARGAVVRSTATGSWRWVPPVRARQVFPQPDGSIVVASPTDTAVELRRLFPPDTQVVGRATLALAGGDVGAQAGDRIYFAGRGGLVGVRARDLAAVPRIEMEEAISVIASTPSGDRIYVLADSARVVRVIDRYRERVEARIELPTIATDVRVDPLGQMALIRSGSTDSVFIIPIGASRVAHTARSAWRSDLPTVAPDGRLVLVQGNDVVLAGGRGFADRERMSEGGGDHWFFFRWSGFRPRAPGLDQPVTFADAITGDTIRDNPFDTLALLDSAYRPDTVDFLAPPPLTPPADDTTRVPVTPPAQQLRGFVVSFATLLNESSARDLANQIRVRGEQARVLPAVQSGMTIYRVILGPYQTREEADRVGRQAGHAFWVFEGTP